MVDIQSKDIIDRMHTDTKIQPAMQLPREFGKQILPVLQVNPLPVIKQISDVAVNDSDKTFTIPSGKQWKLLYGEVVLTSTATVGNRRMSVQFRDENNNVLYLIEAINTQAPSATERYALGQFGDVGESVATRHLLPIPNEAILLENFDIRILDSVAVDPAADDMTIRLMVEESDAVDLN